MDVTDNCRASKTVLDNIGELSLNDGENRKGLSTNVLQHEHLSGQLVGVGVHITKLEKLSEDDNIESNEDSYALSQLNGPLSVATGDNSMKVRAVDGFSGKNHGSEVPLPKVIIFDLDYTLWPFCVDKRINAEPPFCRVPDGRIYDARQREIKAYPDIDNILRRLHSQGYILGIASESFFRNDVISLVKHFGWDTYIKYVEVFPGSKITHFVRIKRKCGIDFMEWLYFDDEGDRLREVVNTCLGVTCVLADCGVSEDVLEKGFKTYASVHLKGTLFEGPYCNEMTKSRSRRGSRCSSDTGDILPNPKLLSRRRGSCFY
ncbi:hypothetical protein ScPMuIL_002023 [Solemya velum]